MIRIILVVVLLGGSTQSSLAQQYQDSEGASENTAVTTTLPPELDRVLRDYEQGWQARDAEALAALFTSDGFILRPGHPPVRGRDNIAQAYRGAGGPLHLRALSYAQSESVAYIIGGYGISSDRPDFGKFILTLRRMPDGHWYITADMDNQNR